MEFTFLLRKCISETLTILHARSVKKRLRNPPTGFMWSSPKYNSSCKAKHYLSEIIQKTVKTIWNHSILVLLLAENNTLTQVQIINFFHAEFERKQKLNFNPFFGCDDDQHKN